MSIGEDFDCHYLEHSGLWAGYSTHFMRFLEERLTIVSLSNYEDFDTQEYAEK
ncbi:hypothetical protein [Paenibacillus sp. B2(2019)]|uniref:hypothetical protein n=1 Tax=Paenibacillus sp. B2(2019) TaxID=2607754 RepID=UPI001CB7454D